MNITAKQAHEQASKTAKQLNEKALAQAEYYIEKTIEPQIKGGYQGGRFLSRYSTTTGYDQPDRGRYHSNTKK